MRRNGRPRLDVSAAARTQEPVTLAGVREPAIDEQALRAHVLRPENGVGVSRSASDDAVTKTHATAGTTTSATTRTRT
jgi:hypothetical protein